MTDLEKRAGLALLIWFGEKPHGMSMAEAYSIIGGTSLSESAAEIAGGIEGEETAGASFSLAWNFGIADAKIGEMVFNQETVLTSWIGVSQGDVLDALRLLKERGMAKYQKTESHLRLVD